MTANAGYTWVLTRVELVLSSPELDPDDVTRRLGLQPTGALRPGPRRWNPGDTSGYWGFENSERSARSLREQLDEVLSAAESCLGPLREILREGVEASVTIHGYADNDSEIVFSPTEMDRMARLGIPLVLSPSLNER
ncbi:DUF4279 domain-containing protein [Streptomyces sp. NPDC005805]|uniref:DUF4279 domain-containing protein n=1 Tax=Streptomyces sp. NPDC005805 TaxID=3157068 RepID=UPI0033C97FB8